MQIATYQVDAFANQLFTGNPAAVCPLDHWLDDQLLQAIAAENNLAETAFIVPKEQGYHIRWFSPTTEVALCGHATLASAYVLFECLNVSGDHIFFDSQSGPLKVSRQPDTNQSYRLTLDFPAQQLAPVDPNCVSELALKPLDCFAGDDLAVILSSETEVSQYQPDLPQIAQLPFRGLILSAPGDDCDFVCRFFAPQTGIDEDPATGSAYTELAPYWSERLGKTEFNARQLSQRGASIHCQLAPNNRVLISGYAKLFLKGTLYLPEAESD